MMFKIITQLTGGTLGFAVMAQQTIDNGYTAFQELSQQVTNGISNTDNLVKGIIASGIIQITLRLIDKWKTKKKQ